MRRADDEASQLIDGLGLSLDCTASGAGDGAQGEFHGGDRFARHWHDVTRLDAAGFAAAAIADKALARAVADHKSMFFAEKNTHGNAIDYHAAVAGGLQLVPDDGALAKLAADYQYVVDDGLFLDDVEPLETPMDRCAQSRKRPMQSNRLNEIQLRDTLSLRATIFNSKNRPEKSLPVPVNERID